MPVPRSNHLAERKPRLRRAGLLAAVLVCATVLSVACSSGPKPRQSPPAAANQEPSTLAYAACVRSNGVPNFPDPNSEGNFVITRSNTGARLLNGVAVDLDSPQYQSAQAACASLLPAGANGRRDEQSIQAVVNFAACMRKNGVPDFPDPTPDGKIRVGMGGVGPNTNTPQFQAAREICAPELDGVTGGTQMRGGAGQ